MKFSRVRFLCSCICLMHICFPFQKKTLSRFLSVFSAFSASNSLHIFQLIPCKSLWDLTSLVSWGDKCFLCDELGYTDLLFSVQPNLFGTTEAYHSVPPISQQEKQFATYSVFLLIQLHSMNLVLYKHPTYIYALCYDSRIKPFLEIDVKGGERDHIKAYHFQRERESITPTGGERDLQGERILK